MPELKWWETASDWFKKREEDEAKRMAEMRATGQMPWPYRFMSMSEEELARYREPKYDPMATTRAAEARARAYGTVPFGPGTEAGVAEWNRAKSIEEAAYPYGRSSPDRKSVV